MKRNSRYGKCRRWTDEQLIEAIRTSKTMSETLTKIGLGNKGTGNFATIKKAISRLQLDISHFMPGKIRIEKLKAYFRGQALKYEEIFNENSKISRSAVIRYIKEHKNIEYKCADCGITDTYNNKPVVLQLDHINGVYNDHRIENLRWLCPTCHSQTKTFGSKNSKRGKELWPKIECKQCKQLFMRKTHEEFCSNVCRGNSRSKAKHKITKEELSILVLEKPLLKIAKELGVSDKAVKKWCMQYGIETPGRGYWAKKYAGKNS